MECCRQLIYPRGEGLLIAETVLRFLLCNRPFESRASLMLIRGTCTCVFPRFPPESWNVSMPIPLFCPLSFPLLGLHFTRNKPTLAVHLRVQTVIAIGAMATESPSPHLHLALLRPNDYHSSTNRQRICLYNNLMLIHIFARGHIPQSQHWKRYLDNKNRFL